MILLFEFLGTLLLASLWNSCFVIGDMTGFLCGFFILLIFSARISGSHFNPAITLAFMFRRDIGRFSRLLGILYIAAQYIGAILGTQLSYNILKARGFPCVVLKGGDHMDKSLIIQAIILEILGSMLLTFLYLTQTEEKTKLSGDPAITTMIISATYTCLFGYSMTSGVVSGTPYNPAVALGEWWSVLFAGNFSTDNNFNMWVCMFFAFAGSLLAVVLFEFVYKPAISTAEEVADLDSEDEEEKLINPSDD